MSRLNSQNMIKRLLIVLSVFLIIVNLSGTVFASANSVKAMLSIPDDSITIATYIANKQGSYHTTKILTYKSKVWSFDNVKYHSLKADEKQEFMEKLLSAIVKSSLGSQAKNKMYNFIANQDTAVTNALQYLKSDANADFVEAKKYFNPLSGGIGIVLGVLCVLIFLFTALSTTIDIFYLALPPFRAVVEKGKENQKPRAVSREAYSSYVDAETSGTYRSAYALYLKRRIWVIFLVMICVGYLISGKIYEIVLNIMDALG